MDWRIKNSALKNTIILPVMRYLHKSTDTIKCKTLEKKHRTMDKKENFTTSQISIIALLRLVKKDKKRTSIIVGIFAVLGIIVAFTTPKTYTSTVMLAPEESGAGFSGSISSLASMVGMNLKIGQTGDALYPEIYPDLVSSTDFAVGLFPIQISTQTGDTRCDYYTYITKHTKTALIDYPKAGLALLMKKLKGKEGMPKGTFAANRTPLWLTSEQYDVVKNIHGNVKCSVDKKTNVITITVDDQDPLVAALMADSIKSHLQVSITEYRTKKAKVDLEYMQTLYHEARQQYDKARQLYASYADANQEVNLQAYKMKETDLENDMQLKYNIYQQVVEQLQLAQAKVQERTPAFTVVQSATVPIKHSSRPKAVTILMWMLLGFFLRASILTWKNKSMFLVI